MSIINKIEAKELKVFAYHPLDENIIKKNLWDAPDDWLFYPNELCERGCIEEADLNDKELKEFLFTHIIPHTSFSLGEKHVK